MRLVQKYQTAGSLKRAGSNNKKDVKPTREQMQRQMLEEQEPYPFYDPDFYMADAPVPYSPIDPQYFAENYDPTMPDDQFLAAFQRERMAEEAQKPKFQFLKPEQIVRNSTWRLNR